MGLFPGKLYETQQVVLTLTLCMLGSFAGFLSSDGDLNSIINCCERSFRNTIRVSNNLDQDQAQHAVGSDQGQSCLQ